MRQDRRDIKDRDVSALKEEISGKLNLEMSVSDEIMSIAKKVNPNQITIVSEMREKGTMAGGLDVRANMRKVGEAVKSFHDQNILASLCIEPDLEPIELAKECGADFIEIHTGKYCNALNKIEVDKEVERIYTAAHHAVKVGIKVSAGHGLNYKNIMPVLKARALEQITIGHSIISRSVFVGLSKAVKEMLDLIE